MISAIWAMDKNGLIGDDDKLPWHYPEDLTYFREVTRGHAVLMGRKTFDSIVGMIGKPLPGRHNIVLTRGGFSYPGVTTINDVQKFISENNEDLFVIGGKEVYNLTLCYCDRLYITYIDKEYKGNVYFPEFDLSNFKLISEKISGDLRFCVYERK